MSKGNRRERQALQLYSEAGWMAYRPATVQFGENDVFGLFDVLAVDPGSGRCHAVQVKSNSASGVRGWMRKVWPFRNAGWRPFYAVPHDGEGWRILAPPRDDDSRAYTAVVDERETDGNMGEGVVRWLNDE